MTGLEKYVRDTPEKPACFMAETGESLSYQQLDKNANRLANYFDTLGFAEGDVIAVLLENDLRYCEITFAARARGLYYTPISWHLGEDEIRYILRDCGARLVFVSASLAAEVQRTLPDVAVVVVGGTEPDRDYDTLRDSQSDERRDHGRAMGKDLCYSSGTTGRPKGIIHKLRIPKEHATATANWVSVFGFSAETTYLSPAPLYHAAPLRFVIRVISGGGTAIIMRKFEAARALDYIETYRVTHSQWVPTMFYRMLALPDDQRLGRDLSSHQVAIHAAAPCPHDIKRRMIDWWGPIIWEYYGGSERQGTTVISSQEWLAHPGSVGRAVLGKVHILGPDDTELGTREVGAVYFDGPDFEYLNDPEKTRASYSRQGFSTLGDIGFLDEDGFLYLTDRKAHTIISGGVNIYPAETENVLIEHPLVSDVSVFGIPNSEFGEEVKAAVELSDFAQAGQALEAELIAFCRARLSSIKAPRSIDFHEKLPRQENGKLNKSVLKKPYLDAAAG